MLASLMTIFHSNVKYSSYFVSTFPVFSVLMFCGCNSMNSVQKISDIGGWGGERKEQLGSPAF